MLHLSEEHPESVAMGAVHKVDSNVLGPDSATLSRNASLAYDLESKSSKRLHLNESIRLKL